MKFFEVEVVNRILNYSAPSIYLESSNEVDAEVTARLRSGLGNFRSESGWRFIPHELRNGAMRVGRKNKSKKQAQKDKAKGA